MRWVRFRTLVWVAGVAVAGAIGTLLLGDYFSQTARTYTPAANQSPAPRLAAVFWSGDMGIHVGFGSDIPERLAARGVPVVAVSSPVLFGEARSAGYARSAVAESIVDALIRSGAQRVTVIGFSFGADLLGATLGKLDPRLRRRIAGVVLVGPASDVHFHANPFGIFYGGLGEAEPRRMAASLRGLPLSCIFAAAEADSLCREPLLREARLMPIDDNHLMLAHREEVTAAVIDAVLHPPEPLP